MDIKLYTVIGCKNCLLIKAYLEDKNVQFEEIDADKDMEATVDVMKKAGVEFLPVVQYDGDNFITGYDKDNLSKLVKLYANS